MNIPSLPTDNLYKFIALFGLVIFSFSIYFSYQIEEKLWLENYKYAPKMQKLEREIYTIQNENILPHEVLKEMGHEELKNYEELLQKIKKESEKKVAEANDIESNYDNLVDTTERNLNFYLAVGLTGGLLMILGFVLWYLKYQRYIDAEVKWNGEQYLKNIRKLKKKKVKKDG
ncbi:hypothetical protein [Costertonia aggregata]|uniref:Uncharacterized protein n=1 Tax=Costertonia aggregata TaxID=343403 RepID=A0A7H9ARF3_9FLAO|nr:hypothetical protein [Costertonia aggregata]QLG46033.1 hypothetical protein HYG79_11990 [Costertonia aggregata]